MKGKTAKESGPADAAGACPKKTGAKGPRRARNDAAWYAKAGVPAVGANFAILQDIAAVPRVLPNGIRLDTVHKNACMVTMPVESTSAFPEMMRQFYAEIREKNSGAAAWDYIDLMAYIMNLRTARASAVQASKMVAAMEAKNPGSQHAASIFSHAAGNNNYPADVVNLANYKNELKLLIDDIETLPVPPMSVFERDEYLYRTIHLDSRGRKPSLMSYIPMVVCTYAKNGTAPNRTLDATRVQRVPDTIAKAIQNARDALAAINAAGVNTIIRGDIRNAFGSQAYRRTLSADVNSPLHVSVEDPEIMAQNENAAVLGSENSVTFTNMDVIQSWSESTDKITVKCEMGGATNPDIDSRAEFNERLINTHKEAVSDAELLAITRLDAVAEQENDLTKSWWRLSVCDGNVLLDTIFVTGITADGAFQASEKWGDLNAKVHGVTPFAEMKKLTFFLTTMAHSPMCIVDDADPYGYIWNLDDFAIISSADLDIYTTWSVKSQYMAPRPRGEHGRVEGMA